MNELAKRIARVQRREVAGGMGFGAAKRAQPRAMLLAARAKDHASATEARDAGADAVLYTGLQPGSAKAALKGLDKECIGAFLAELDESSADALREAGLAFVVSPLAGTASAAVDTEKLGQVVSVSFDISDSTLRSLGPLGLDALYVEGEASAPTLAGQLELVRLSSFSGLPLVVNVRESASEAELRVLRDSGAAIVVAPAEASATELKRLGNALQAVPPPRRSQRANEMALVPSLSQQSHEEDDEVEDPE